MIFIHEIAAQLLAIYTDNIQIIDRNNINLDKSFFEIDFKSINYDIYHKYSITKWVETIFKDNNE